MAYTKHSSHVNDVNVPQYVLQVKKKHNVFYLANELKRFLRLTG